jgi:coenzyme F420-0:L-glutamate ligase / coenzyme F420-1:gamma-L-glutamate ligase
LSLRVWPLAGIPEIHPGDDLSRMIATLAVDQGVAVGDTLMIAHKVVSKSEGRLVELAGVASGEAAAQLSELTGKSPQLCELILAESAAIVRRRGSTLICRTHHGFVCANAGIDSSNAPHGWVILLPVDPDASARRIAAAVSRAVGGRVGVIITDTHGRAFRRGLVNIAIGVAGLEAVMDRRGETDREGRVLVATEQAFADELAAVSGIFMPKAGGSPVVVASGVATIPAPGTAAELVRRPEHDLFVGGDADHGGRSG